MRRLIRFLLVLALVVLAALAAAWWIARPATPDAFYAPDAPLPEAAGRLLRAAPMTAGVPPGAQGWRILYTTTRSDGAVVAASGVVVVPEAAPGALPVVAYAHGTSGAATGCAPSLFDDPFPDVPGYPRLLREGWAIVATDYVGLGTAGDHHYLVGADAGRAVLDALRAARALDAADLDGPAVVWGHSQGGHAALWAGQIAPDYAPEARLTGVAALSPASDLPALVARPQDSAFGRIVSAYLVAGYAAAYPEADPWSYTDPWLRPVVRDMAGRCVTMPGVLLSVAQARLFPPGGVFARNPTESPLGARLAENVPRGPFAMPVLIGQGDADALVPEEVQRGYVDSLCAANAPVTYRALSGHDHLSLVQPDSPMVLDLVDWTRDRFTGEPPPRPCR